MDHRKLFRVTVPSADLAAFLDECVSSDWHALDTGERVMTDEGPDAEAVLLVDPAARLAARTAAPMLV